MVCRQQRIGDVPQVHLELADAVLGHRATDRQLLHGRRFIHAIEEHRHVLDRIERQIAGAAGWRTARQGADGNAAVWRPARIDQVELELAGHHRMEPGGPALRHHVGENLARVEPQLLARGQVHHLAGRLRGRRRGPRHALQESAQRPGNGVGITVRLAHAAGVVAEPAAVGDRRAGRVHHAVLEKLGAVGCRQALAGGVAVEVDDEGINRLDVGVGGLERLPIA